MSTLSTLYVGLDTLYFKLSFLTHWTHQLLILDILQLLVCSITFNEKWFIGLQNDDFTLTKMLPLKNYMGNKIVISHTKKLLFI